jgi:hypothetical protein
VQPPTLVAASSCSSSSRKLPVTTRAKQQHTHQMVSEHVLMQLPALHCCAQGTGVLAQGQRHSAARRYIHAGRHASYRQQLHLCLVAAGEAQRIQVLTATH